MNNQYKWLWVSIGGVALLSIGLLIDMVGSVSIRSNESSYTQVALSVVSPLVPGVAAPVKWDVPYTITDRQVGVMLRMKNGTIELLKTHLYAGAATVVMPCTIAKGAATLELISAEDKSLLSWKAVTILPAGRDCVR